MDFVAIDTSRFRDAVKAYWLWKELNAIIKNSHNRGVNFPETISETVACYALGFELNRGSGDDARNPRNGETIEFKATSNWDRDTSSFSPREITFDHLYFIRLNQREDKAYIYDLYLTKEELEQVEVNSTQRLLDQQRQGRRPRFSIINRIINRRDIQPVAFVDFRKETVQDLP